LRPTSREHVAVAACLEAPREVSNAALQERRDGWSFSSQQTTLRRLNKAFAGFFRRVKAAHKPGHSRFTGRARFDSVEWPKDGDGARWLPDQRRVSLQGAGQVKVHLHRQVQGRVT